MDVEALIKFMEAVLGEEIDSPDTAQLFHESMNSPEMKDAMSKFIEAKPERAEAWMQESAKRNKRSS